jgi:hypothetical protein
LLALAIGLAWLAVDTVRSGDEIRADVASKPARDPAR